MVGGITALVLIGGAAMLVASRTRQLVDTKEMQAKQDIGFIRQVLERYKKDHGRYPTAEESLNALVDPSPAGRYFISKHAIIDPWGHAYIYKPSNWRQDEAVVVYSRGPNGIDEGGAGDDTAVRK
jgi:general secretion pathway protein G